MRYLKESGMYISPMKCQELLYQRVQEMNPKPVEIYKFVRDLLVDCHDDNSEFWYRFSINLDIPPYIGLPVMFIEVDFQNYETEIDIISNFQYQTKPFQMMTNDAYKNLQNKDCLFYSISLIMDTTAKYSTEIMENLTRSLESNYDISINHKEEGKSEHTLSFRAKKYQ